MFDPNDSIDGLGLTVADLSEAGWRKALVRVMHRTEAAASQSALDDETRVALARHLKSANIKDDKAREALERLINPMP